AGADVLKRAHGCACEFVIVALESDQAGSGRFRKSDAKPDLRRSANEDFVEIFDSLDEVRLSDDDVGALRYLDANGCELHILRPVALTSVACPSTRGRIAVVNDTALRSNGSSIARSYSNRRSVAPLLR